jgi:hypothetical protein
MSMSPAASIKLSISRFNIPVVLRLVAVTIDYICKPMPSQGQVNYPRNRAYQAFSFVFTIPLQITPSFT